MHVLQLVNTPRSFFEQQVQVLQRAGVACTVLSVPGDAGADSGHSPLDYLRFQGSLLRESLEDYDLVHANYGLLGPLSLAQPRRPVVLTLWGSEVMGYARWLDRVSGTSARLSDAVVVPWPTMSSYLSCDHTVVPWGVDTDRFRPIPREEARERVGWETDRRIVLFPYPESRTVKNYPLARSVVDRADVEADLRTVSGVPHEQVPYYMNASDAVLVTSRRESGPMVVKEAAACNVPVVSTDVGSVRGMLDGVSRSFVADSEDDLVTALEQVLLSGERSDGRETVDDLGLERMGEQLLDVYERVLDRA